MKLFLFGFLCLLLSFSDVFAQKKWKRLLNPTDKVTLGISGKFMTVPYAYLFEDSNVILKKHGIVNVHESPFGSVNMQFLYPSLAPPPDNCSFENKPCTGKAVAGFDAPPKGQKQIYVNYTIARFEEFFSNKRMVNNAFYGRVAEDRRKRGLLRDRHDLGLVESYAPASDSGRYIPIKPLKLFTSIDCFHKHCRIYQEDEPNLLRHHILIHRDQLPNWRKYIASRDKLLEKFPLE